MENKCQRCYSRRAIFNCPSCEKFHNYCQNCDDYIHSSKKNKSHKRYYLNITNENIENSNNIINAQTFNNNYQNNSNNINNNSEYNLNISSNNKKKFNTFPNNAYTNDNNNSQEENNTPSFYKFQTYYNSSKKNNKKENNNFDLSSKYNNEIYNEKNINNSNIIKNNYSGLKNIKNQIEYIQKNISSQINQVLKNIDNKNQNMNYEQQLLEIEKRYKDKINKLMLMKNNEINVLEEEIKEANKTNNTLMNEISKANEDNNIKIIELTNIINSLKDELNQKEEQILILKGKSSKEHYSFENEIDEEKNMICNEYEKKINNILNISEHNQQKLMNIIREKDVIIHNLINCNKDKNNEFNEFVGKINEDNKNLKNIAEQSLGIAKDNLFSSMNNNNFNDNLGYNI